MKKPQIPKNESERLRELESYQIIGALENQDYDFITSMAAQLCGTKISLISLITENEQWFLSHHGINAKGTPRDYSFCAHTINNKKPLIIENAYEDERFYDNPLTTEQGVIFYAGVPLVTSNGYAVGTLCTIDSCPRKLSKSQIEHLKKLAIQTVRLFELRRKEIELDTLNNQLNQQNEILLQTQKINNVGSWEMDIESGKTTWNDVVYEIHDVPTNFDNSKAEEFYHPKCKEIINNAISECISKKEPFNLVCRLVTSKDKLKWVRTTGRKIGNKIIGSLQDISTLTHSEFRFKSILEGTNSGTWEWNIETGETIFNERWAEIIGYTLEELDPISIDTWFKLAHPDDLRESNRKLNLCFDKKVTYYEIETRMKHKNGHWVWVHDKGKIFEWTKDGKPLMMCGTHQDITERKQSERSLEEAVSKFEAILDASKYNMIITTDKKGIITLFNSGAEQRLGYKAEELIGKLSPGIFHLPEELELENKRLGNKYNEEIKGFDIFTYEANIGRPSTKEWTLVSKSGEKFLALLSIDAIRIKDEIVGYLGVVSDISKLKEKEKEIKLLLDVTNEQNDRLRNFTQIVSHNLRSHSAGISQLLTLIQTQLPEVTSNELIQHLQKGVENLNQTVNDLSDIIKINFSNTKTVETKICDVLEKNIDSLRLQIQENNLEIINNINKNLLIKAIPAYIDSIVLNMITNAIKYKNTEKPSYLSINASIDQNKIVIYFADNGLGIDLKRHGDQIFGMYKTFHDHKDARGVGLFITKNQIHSMGGKITVESEVNVGTTFKIELPR